MDPKTRWREDRHDGHRQRGLEKTPESGVARAKSREAVVEEKPAQFVRKLPSSNFGDTGDERD